MYRITYMIDAPYAGGAERYVALLVQGLDRERFEPSVIARTGDGLDRWCDELRAMDVRVARVRMRLPFSPGDAVPITRAVEQLGPHLVHLNMPGPYDAQMGLLAPIARLAGAAAVVATEHLPMVERLWKRAAVKHLSGRWIDRVLTVCEANVPFLLGRQRVPAHKITVVHNAIRSTYGARREHVRERMRQSLGIDGDTVALVMVGSLIKRKGLHVLIEALAGVPKAPWRLFVVGTGEERSACEGMAASLAIGERVGFLGHMSDDEVEDVLCAMDGLVLPSFMEGLPYVILEAMACALPVVASDINGVPEASPDGEAALLVPAGDVGALRHALDTLITSPTQRRELGRRGRERFEARYTLHTHADRMKAVYLDLLGGRA